ncbi:MAG: glycosyl hydrolase, partial [Bacteroidota bacterium]
AGTEKGMYVSWNGGQNWESFQLNLPKTPILDLMVHQGDLIVATSGRSFWILDDLGLLKAYSKPQKAAKLYQPEPAYNGFWGSALNGNSPSFKGSQPFTGVNPANGMVLYYELPKLDSAEISMEIYDAKGKLINSFSSKKDASYKRYDGGPPPAPKLDKKEGLNRFVWNMGHAIMPGVKDTYIEANYRGHRAIPGNYTIKLKVGDNMLETTGEIKEIPTYNVTSSQYEAFDTFMTETEGNLTEMHNMVNMLFKAKNQLKEVLKKVTNESLKKEGKDLIAELDAWDKEMIQRKSKAYDDVENFPNKFTAEYMFLINASDSSIPRINQSSIDRRMELDQQWVGLKQRGKAFENVKIPALNKKLWEAGVGAVQL